MVINLTETTQWQHQFTFKAVLAALTNIADIKI
jgi:hypothetical protein